LATLTRIVNWRSAAAVLQTWLVIGATLGVALAYWSWPLWLAAVVIIGTQQHALFILSHDAAHYRLFSHRGINDLIGRVCASAAGLSMCTYRVIHRLHHNHLYGPEDPDIALHGGYPRGKWYLVKKLLKDLSALTAVKTYGYFGNPRKRRCAEPVEPACRHFASAAPSPRDQKLVIALQLTLPALTSGSADGRWACISLWVLPVTVLQAILRLRRASTAPSLTYRHLTAARTHAPDFSPHGWCHPCSPTTNHHVEHHLYPPCLITI
jgi:fatty acid desaturase